ncbi:autotransporter outer membrane beta-barrel domain-containing protein [Bartonella krasnovii]|uniref:autotransporter family protein n=1 Tax=Bartonella krasnovii TaxID=2267275 RepID=UPI001F4CD118|nr:autotransporter outer membrane beta-barrel domain-containing protein [Bartonella krasnovii]UNF36715.1 autotransporter outer membrane beta-barrel domain-containing protein [Bartonella krasnovii]UNF51651.1 autotransporter outer membrane beta-barrel domain-containing protein [Bartonella krasnovii]
MCKKYIYKKNFLLCTIAGTFIFSHLAPTHANIQPSEIPTVQVTNGEEKNLNNVFIRGKYDAVVARKGHVTIANSIMHSGFTLLSAASGGQINAKGIIGRAEERGLSLTNGTIHVEDSTINVIGHSKIYGINFGYILSSTIQEGEEVINKAILNNTKLLVKNGVGIFGPSYSKAVANAVYLKNSEIRSDMLLENGGSPFTQVQPTTFTLDADNSIMEGRAKTLPQNTTIFTLNNNSNWHLKISLFELENSFSLFDYTLLDLKQRAQSVVSILNLNDSSIIFDAPHKLADNHYQTLHIGRHPQKTEQNRSSNGTAVYNATGNAKIYFNTEWSNGLPKEQQKTDRVLIRGDVSGTTTVYFNNLSKHAESFDNKKAKDSIPLNGRGLSLIQVSGQANEDSFKLAHGYITMGGLPYKYILNSYGPTSRLGKADNQQSLFPEGGEFWDFRLQNITLDLMEEIKALVPQVASYLVMPNAIFSSGLADVSNQNTLLDNMHSTVFGLEGHKKKGIFLSTYGNKVTLSSSRSPLEYGYGADVCYAALQAGMTLATLENQNLTVNFGLLGTYGKLAFTPKDMKGSDKSILDKWSFTSYGNLHHDNGLYINALLSYGILNGHITTALIGNTAEINNTDILNISAAVGQKLATGVEGLSFEPQAQLIYQHIAFGTLSDIDDFQVNIKTPHQWLVRVGGRLTKTILPIENDRVLSFYGKLNVIKAFGEKSTIDIGEPFRLDSMGSSLEGGLGINAQLSKNIALHADVNYQHKLQKSGISGVNFSGGMRYRF